MGHHLYALATQNLMQFLNEKKFGVTPKWKQSFPGVLVAHTSRNAAAEERSILSLSLSLSLSLFLLLFSSLLFSSVWGDGFNERKKITQGCDNRRVYFPRPKNRPAPGRLLWRSSFDLDSD
jgi:hypothetical protein